MLEGPTATRYQRAAAQTGPSEPPGTARQGAWLGRRGKGGPSSRHFRVLRGCGGPRRCCRPQNFSSPYGPTPTPGAVSPSQPRPGAAAGGLSGSPPDLLLCEPSAWG
ncbi:unnamed protein product [Eretmochelys imbricata]